MLQPGRTISRESIGSEAALLKCVDTLRGRDEEEDQALEKELLADPKEIAEHLMLIDLGRSLTKRSQRFFTNLQKQGRHTAQNDVTCVWI